MKKIIVMGSGKSGSSAVVDYLAGRPDIVDPLKGVEFRLIQDPGGIANLHYAIGRFFQVNLANAAIKSFSELCKRMAKPQYAVPPGLGYANLIDDFLGKVVRYIDDIIEIEYSGVPWYEASNNSFSESIRLKFLRNVFKLKNIKPQVGKMYLPVHEDLFLDKTRQFLNSILNKGTTDHEVKAILVNQGGNFWTPLTSTIYYGDRQVIVVTRDPRDIFSEMKRKGYAYPGHDVQVFCSWYDNIMQRVRKLEWENRLVIHIQFENFVNNHQGEKQKLVHELGLAPYIESSYDIVKSKKNIGKYHERLTKIEKELIENRLNLYLFHENKD